MDQVARAHKMLVDLPHLKVRENTLSQHLLVIYIREEQP